MKLYGYWRSSAAYRVRIGLNLKNLEVEEEFVHLQRLEQRGDDYLTLNPQGLVPTLIDGDVCLSQSLAILEYLDETHPEPPLLPSDPAGRARVRQLAQVVACDIHPIDNLKVLNFLTNEMGVSDEGRLTWYRHWVNQGLEGLEGLVASHPATGRFCHGDQPSLADLCLVPQLYNARRFDVNLDLYPILQSIDAACQSLQAFTKAAPEAQSDAVQV
ncbi:MAG: maleylacetoacetate isomerase [Rhodospirillaceae bacterium]|jgi:maleylacetoacetate isomerase|nr:maleylacetoacetate isomerase [Rhodospirillaceae bacterium]MBT5193201.1 maleylacetoacetate isomerase [Rhodospirillaceae bacterium]MBT5897325.1 maleylacetoacetate isomerase [Rhodospirillaceae bacterium]MBT6430453.1 maleylacetoacetate isomerase [Rhodospirillaceae bacterium]MBT6982758.1 maleylacetoacetate isomerase [Rhodospirillaceae bacterium]